jgi:glycosyltransferase involved in cell wall biosynthesis
MDLEEVVAAGVVLLYEKAARLRRRRGVAVDRGARGVDARREDVVGRRLRAQLGFAEGDIVCVYTGRLTAAKDPLCLARAIAELQRDGLSFGGLFLGDGPRMNAVRKLLPDAIMPGYVVGEELSMMYASSDVFCFASATEAFGNVSLFQATINSINKFAAGIADTYPLATLCEAISRRTPTIVVPFAGVVPRAGVVPLAGVVPFAGVLPFVGRHTPRESVPSTRRS